MLSTPDSEEKICRICYNITNPFSECDDLISPCNCKGSVKYVHSTCLKMWRFKTNLFREVKMCEQCKVAYTCTNDKLSHRYVITAFSFLAIGGSYIFMIFFFSSFFQLILMVCDGIHDVQELKTFSQPFDIANGQYHLTSIMLLTSICKVLLNPSIFAIFNYFFTFWRIIQFGFIADKALFVVMTMFFLKETFCSVYHKIDRFYFIFINRYSF